MPLGDKNNSEISGSQNNNNNLDSMLTNVSEMIRLTEGLLDIFNVRISLINLNNELLYTSNNSEKIIGYTFDDFKYLNTFGYLHPDDREKAKKKFSTFKKSDFTDPYDYRIFKPNGELRWMRGVAYNFVNTTTNEQIGYFLIEFDVSDEQVREDDSNINEILLKGLLELNIHPLLYTKNHQIIWTNEHWLKFFDYPKESVLDKPIGFLFSNQDDYAKFLFDCNKSLKKNGFIEYFTTLQDSKKNEFQARIFARAIDKNNLSQGMIIYFSDTKKTITPEVKKDTNRGVYESILKNWEIILVQVTNNKIIWINDYVSEILQYTRDELIGKDIEILFQTKNASKSLVSEINRSFLAKRNYVGEIVCIRKDRMPTGFNIRAVSQNYDQKSGMLLFLEPNDELRKLIIKLRDEKSQLEFYSDLLFHDVRNLCQDAVLQIDLSIAKTVTSPDESIRKQNRGRLEILRIGELISNIDMFFKTKRKDYDLHSIDIFNPYMKAVEKIRLKFEPRLINIDHNVKPGKYLTIANDWLEDIFFNILNNAVRYDKNPEANIQVSVQKSIENVDFWKIVFSDNGPGIDDELKKNLFDRYARSKGTIHGSGFGLTLVKEIVESYNGFISVEDRDPTNPSKGINIIIELPKSVDE
ncbi:MAG: PAS domain-containing protein [Candidatus Heimdallarchaeota archaeon]